MLNLQYEKTGEALKLELQDARNRIPVEGKFGNCKRKYGLDRIFTKKAETSECEIAMGILILNLDKLCRDNCHNDKPQRVSLS